MSNWSTYACITSLSHGNKRCARQNTLTLPVARPSLLGDCRGDLNRVTKRFLSAGAPLQQETKETTQPQSCLVVHRKPKITIKLRKNMRPRP